MHRPAERRWKMPRRPRHAFKVALVPGFDPSWWLSCCGACPMSSDLDLAGARKLDGCWPGIRGPDEGRVDNPQAPPWLIARRALPRICKPMRSVRGKSLEERPRRPRFRPPPVRRHRRGATLPPPTFCAPSRRPSFLLLRGGEGPPPRARSPTHATGKTDAHPTLHWTLSRTVQYFCVISRRSKSTELYKGAVPPPLYVSTSLRGGLCLPPPCASDDDTSAGLAVARPGQRSLQPRPLGRFSFARGVDARKRGCSLLPIYCITTVFSASPPAYYTYL